MDHQWYSQRKHLESHRKSHLYGRIRYSLFAKVVLKVLKVIFRIKFIRSIFQKLALKIVVKEHTLDFSELPSAFHNYKILHMTDFHLDLNPYLAEVIGETIVNLDYDLVLLTGDYQDSYKLDSKEIAPYLKTIKNHIKPKVPIIATLGNHDNTGTAYTLKDLGVEVLINKPLRLAKQNDHITILGLDDIHSFFTPCTLKSLNHLQKDEFNILAVHSPEMFSQAASAKVNLYLCGHTHGGQVCLPNGYPLITYSKSPHHMANGLWSFEGMLGYTNTGTGTSGIPLRAFCPGEVAVLTLKNSQMP